MYLSEYTGTDLELVALDEETNKSDSELARASIRNVLKVSNENLGAILHLAKSTEHPRAFEVAATFAKTIVDAATKLEDMIEQKNRGTGKTSAPNQTITNQTNVITTSEEAMKMFRERAKAMKSVVENQT